MTNLLVIVFQLNKFEPTVSSGCPMRQTCSHLLHTMVSVTIHMHFDLKNGLIWLYCNYIIVILRSIIFTDKVVKEKIAHLFLTKDPVIL